MFDFSEIAIKEESKTALDVGFTFPELLPTLETPVLGPKTAAVIKLETPVDENSPPVGGKNGSDTLTLDLSVHPQVDRIICPVYPHQPWGGMERRHLKNLKSSFFRRRACIDRITSTGNMVIHWANCPTSGVPKDARALLQTLGDGMLHGRPATKGSGNRPKFIDETRFALCQLVYGLCVRGRVPNASELAAEVNAVLKPPKRLTAKTMRRCVTEITAYNGIRLTYDDIKKSICGQAWFRELVAKWLAPVA